MQRIPNPGSNLDVFVRIFREAYEELAHKKEFDLDDLTRAMIAGNNVSSQGSFGDEALARSTRTDRSRDPLYNQSKMYAELFRALGWIQSTTSALRFAFSWLGAHVATAHDPKPLVIECLLGWAYPSEVLSTKGEQSVRIFVALLRAMSDVGGKLKRDEMILGPLSVSDDRDDRAWNVAIDRVMQCRAGRHGLQRLLNEKIRDSAITHTTMGNYTRFPIAALQWAGWAEKDGGAFRLTEHGVSTLNRVQRMTDLRLPDVQHLQDDVRDSLISYATLQMLSRAGFDVGSQTKVIESAKAKLTKARVLSNGDPLFSPFQQLARPIVNAVFPPAEGVTERSMVIALPKPALVAAAARPQRIFDRTSRRASVSASIDPSGAHYAAGSSDEIARYLIRRLRDAGGLADALELIASDHERDNQAEFYPFVEALWRHAGLDCTLSRRGVNYARADALIIAKDDAIPIEIKSPGEETELSVKAIRQAVENKVILLSRKAHPSKYESATFVVGFNDPNPRSEVHELIENVRDAFGFNVAVFGVRSLVRLCYKTMATKRNLTIGDVARLKGVVNG